MHKHGYTFTRCDTTISVANVRSPPILSSGGEDFCPRYHLLTATWINTSPGYFPMYRLRPIYVSQTSKHAGENAPYACVMRFVIFAFIQKRLFDPMSKAGFLPPIT